ncbi:hypothetical protein FHG87_002065 [Trinorchestia longiramus]|nr:hypothetical protein FHG87_002065 [Trinorchestia longiramus]
MDEGFEKSRSADRGWNDPPPVLTSVERHKHSNPQATRKRLNKRVPIPLSSGPASLSNSFSSSGCPPTGRLGEPPPAGPPPAGPPPAGPPPARSTSVELSSSEQPPAAPLL